MRNDVEKRKIEIEIAHEQKKMAWDNVFYCNQRIDLLIIAISGAGIYVCLETIKYLNDNEMIINSMVRISGALFLLAIIINFIGQFFGKKTNEKVYYSNQTDIEAGEHPTDEEKKEIQEYCDQADKFDKIVSHINWISTIFMLSGLVLIMCYFLFIF